MSNEKWQEIKLWLWYTWRIFIFVCIVLGCAQVLAYLFEPQPAHAPRYEATIADERLVCQTYAVGGRAIEFCAAPEVVEPMITEPCAAALARGKARVVCPEVERGLVGMERRKE